jgi:hypothetical protein
VSKQCAHCGKIQPSDSTRYCSKCGKILPSSRPIKSSLSGGPPAWMKQLESSLTKPLTNIPPRELRVNVEEQEKPENHSLLENNNGSFEGEEDVVDDLPTRPLSVVGSPRIDAQSLTTSNQSEESIDDEEIEDDLPTMPLIASLPETLQVQHISPSSANGNVAHLDEIEKILTRPIAAQRQSISPAAVNHVQQHRQASQAPFEPVHSPVLQRPVTPMLFPQPLLSPVQTLRQTPPVSMPVPPVAHPERKSRRRLMVVFVLLFILLLGGVVAWLILLQPFAVPEVTKTTQSFQNANLGISLQYPQQWKAEVHEQNGTVYFYDDNHTDQVNITVVATGGQSIDQYSSKVAGSLGMTGQKTEASLSIAGASWQQVQGNVQQSGATYTATLLVTIHGGRYYTILQLAPSSTYLHEDQLVFSIVRSSFQFL